MAEETIVCLELNTLVNIDLEVSREEEIPLDVLITSRPIYLPLRTRVLMDWDN